ncbi:hypothetical protein BGZ83_008217 [Gryganskiella cystojenkinii]|nr:hypothetical protein BGZ83_008217 [Gryganskiella cystojenkinii]
METTTRDPNLLPFLRVIRIHELFDCLQAYLTSNSDLVALTLVCREFTRLFNPLLWHTIEIKTKKQHDLFVSTPEVQQAIRRHGHAYIRVIRIRTPKSLAPFYSKVGPLYVPGSNVDNENDTTMLLNLHTLEFPWPGCMAFEEMLEPTIMHTMEELYGLQESEPDISNSRDGLCGFYKSFRIDMSSSSTT